MQQQQQLLSAAPRKKKEELSPSPWWDFFGHCKEAADSSSDSEDDTHEQNDDTSCAAHANYNVMCATGPTNSSNDDLIIIKEESAPLRIKSIGTRFNSSIKADGDTPRTHASSTCLSFPDEYDDHDDERIDSSLQTIGVEVEMGDIEDIISDDEYNFIGYVDIMPISPLLSTQQRNIRKNAYDLLKRMGEEESMFDLNSVVVEVEQEEEEVNYYEQRLKQHQTRVHEEVDELKRQLRECINLVSEIHANLRSYSNDAAATNDNGVTSAPAPAPAGMNKDEAEVEDENIMATLDTEIANLKSQLQSATIISRQLMHGSRRDFPLPVAMDRESSNVDDR